jgi:hypothetical protein
MRPMATASVQKNRSYIIDQSLQVFGSHSHMTGDRLSIVQSTGGLNHPDHRATSLRQANQVHRSLLRGEPHREAYRQNKGKQ